MKRSLILLLVLIQFRGVLLAAEDKDLFQGSCDNVGDALQVVLADGSKVYLLFEPQSPNFYKRLGVTSDASEELLKRAYKAAAILHHPDKGGDNRSMQLVNEAYSVLRDAEARRRYDARNPEFLEPRKPSGAEQPLTSLSEFEVDFRQFAQQMRQRSVANTELLTLINTLESDFLAAVTEQRVKNSFPKILRQKSNFHQPDTISVLRSFVEKLFPVYLSEHPSVIEREKLFDDLLASGVYTPKSEALRELFQLGAVDQTAIGFFEYLRVGMRYRAYLPRDILQRDGILVAQYLARFGGTYENYSGALRGYFGDQILLQFISAQ